MQFARREFPVFQSTRFSVSMDGNTIDTRRALCGLRAKVLASDLSQSINHGKTDDGINGELITRILDGSDLLCRRIPGIP